MITQKIPLIKLLKLWLLAGIALVFCLGLYEVVTKIPISSIAESVTVYLIQGSIFLLAALWALSTIGVNFKEAFYNYNADIKNDLISALKYFFIYAGTATAVVLILALIGMLLTQMGLFTIDALQSQTSKTLKLAEQAYLHKIIKSPFTFLVYLFSTCILIPVEEEIFFRRLLYGSLRDKMGFAASLFITSSIFSLVHIPAASAVSAFVVGLFLGWIYEKKQNLPVNIMVHGLINFSVTMLMIFMG